MGTDHVGDQPLVADNVLANHDDRIGHLGMAPKRDIDFASSMRCPRSFT